VLGIDQEYSRRARSGQDDARQEYRALVMEGVEPGDPDEQVAQDQRGPSD
jgi:hypothetical protein